MGRVLIADDDLFIRMFLHIALERAGHEVREAVDGREAMQHYAEWRPECVITDLVMPGQEGIETIMQMRRHEHRAFIIATSGHTDGRTAIYLKMARSLGADEVLEKPFSMEQLMPLVAAHVDGKTGQAGG